MKKIIVIALVSFISTAQALEFERGIHEFSQEVPQGFPALNRKFTVLEITGPEAKFNTRLSERQMKRVFDALKDNGNGRRIGQLIVGKTRIYSTDILDFGGYRSEILTLQVSPLPGLKKLGVSQGLKKTTAWVTSIDTFYSAETAQAMPRNADLMVDLVQKKKGSSKAYVAFKAYLNSKGHVLRMEFTASGYRLENWRTETLIRYIPSIRRALLKVLL